MDRPFSVDYALFKIAIQHQQHLYRLSFTVPLYSLDISTLHSRRRGCRKFSNIHSILGRRAFGLNTAEGGIRLRGGFFETVLKPRVRNFGK